jgi:hypothetical protein
MASFDTLLSEHQHPSSSSRCLAELRGYLRDRNACELERVLGTREGRDAANEGLEPYERRALWQLAVLDTSALAATWLLHAVVKALPDGLTEPVLVNQPHSIPISLALDKQEIIPKTLLETMVECAPQSAEIGFPGGGFLLHKAARCKAHHDLLAIIYHAYPDAIRVQDRHGNLPIHIFLRSNGVSHSKRKRTVQFLLQEYPEGASIRNKMCKTTLHIATEKVTMPLDIFQLVLERFSVDKNRETTHLTTPLATACHTWDDSTMVRSLRLACSKLSLLLKTHPEAALQVDINGRIPFQTIKSDVIRTSLIQQILTTDIGPTLASMGDVNGNNMLHLLAAFVPESSCIGGCDSDNKSKVESLQNSIFVRAFSTKEFTGSHLAQLTNFQGELPLHIRLKTKEPRQDISDDIDSLLEGFSEGAAIIDPTIKLYPFMQGAVGDQAACLSTTFLLLQRLLCYRTMQDMRVGGT